VLAAFLVELLPARVRQDVAASLITLVAFTAILVGGPALGVVTAPGAVAALAFRRSSHSFAERAAVNLGQLALAALIAGHVFELLGGAAWRDGAVTSVGGVGAVLVMAVVHTLISNLLIGVVILVTSGDSLRSTFGSLSAAMRLNVLVDVGLSILAATVLLEIGAPALVLLLIPALVARHGLLGFQREADAYDRLVRAFVKVIEVKDGYTRGHAERVAELAEAVAGELGYDYDARREIRYAALLHDVGKVGTDPGVLNKPGPLTDSEFEHIRVHPTVGVEILAEVDFLAPALDAVRHHHERWDGRGYPHGLAGSDIPETARIVTVVDAFDAMTSTRSYRPAMTVGVALEELERFAGSQFDPRAVEALAAVTRTMGWEPTTNLDRERRHDVDPRTSATGRLADRGAKPAGARVIDLEDRRGREAG
jgi:putative nucleotidyltransferase with HDIG domain